MKTIISKRILTACLTTIVMLTLAGCADDNNEWSKDYDIEWPVSTITAVQPLQAAPGDLITITGVNLQHTYYFYIGSFDCEVVNKSETSLTIRVPALVTEASSISVFNVYRRTYVYPDGLFTPILE
ncbi:MAG: IPT/TIG domain-containing protein [Tannerellaceae bacterium]|jgi:hypothetical protein|nr:IPT/TIG domain-containing protein [Tannerellaceae bacterium]